MREFSFGVSDKKEAKVYSWCTSPDDLSLQQIEAIAWLPFSVRCALMPDAHAGIGMPIGGVVALEGVVIPNAVGVDIGCGMGAVKTDIRASDFTEDKRQAVVESLAKRLPMGFDRNPDDRRRILEQTWGGKFGFAVEKTGVDKCMYQPLVKDLREAFFSQLGTLGGGNHFLEFQADDGPDGGCVWIMIHSGSRNIGHRVCSFFGEAAARLNRLYFSVVPEELAFLPVGTLEGKEYLAWMEFSLMFAYYNREAMMCLAEDELTKVFPNAGFGKLLNIHHNYASLERHFGKDVWVHRKGATLAAKDARGIIPGSMGTRSYIVRGLGNPLSMCSCSHGAGRRMGRMEFNREMNTEDGIAAVNKAMDGVVHLGFGRQRTRKGKDTGMIDVSEAPQAYKDIGEVMRNQADLVSVETELRPLAVVKDREED